MLYVNCVLFFSVPTHDVSSKINQVNPRENRRGNQEWKIQRKWQHRVHKTQDEENKTNNIIVISWWSVLLVDIPEYPE